MHTKSCGECLESMGVSSGCVYQEMGVASGWNLRVRLQCMVRLVGAVVRRYS